MDAGMVCNTANTTPITWEMALEKGELVLEGISGGLEPGELLGLLSTWLEGHSLAQTVLTNLYCMVLKAVCVPSLKFVELVKDIIGKAGV